MGNIIKNLKDKSEYSTSRDVDDLRDVSVVDVFDYKINNTEEEINPSAGDQSSYEAKREINDNDRRKMVYHYEAHRDIGNTVALTRGISISPATMSIAVGGSASVVATVTPAEADQRVRYESDAESVATVGSSGIVTGVSAGAANITVRTWDGVYSAVCAVTVS